MFLCACQIVERIVPHIHFQEDLLNLRLLNHVFQKEATKKLNILHNHIVLKNEDDPEEFASCMKNRESLNLTPFPFSAVHVDLELDLEALDTFAKELGQHISRYRYSYQPIPSSQEHAGGESSVELGAKVAVLLSHSDQLTELQLDSIRELRLSEQAQLCLPTSFPRLRVFRMSKSHFTVQLGRPDALIDILINRAPQLQNFALPVLSAAMSRRITNYFLQNRPNNLPYFSFGETLPLRTMDRSSTRLIQHLTTGFNISFKEISISLRARRPAEISALSRTVSAFLERQSDSLTELCLKFLTRDHLFLLPSLRVLTTLTIHFSIEELGQGWPTTSPIFNGNPFPVLKKLRLEFSQRTRLNIRKYPVEKCSLTSVHEFEVPFSESQLTNSSWRRTFPNLSSFQIQVSPPTRYSYDGTYSAINALNFYLTNNPFVRRS